MSIHDKKYQEKYNTIIFELKLAGKTNNEIIKCLDISKKTFYQWLKKYSELKKLYIKATLASKNAKEALINKALGFTKLEKTVTNNGKIVEYEKYYPPDFQSIKYLLRNISDFDKELEHKISNDNKEFEFKKQVHKDLMKKDDIDTNEDDGFIEALQSETKNIWADESLEDETEE